jgi:hypothetical protein
VVAVVQEGLGHRIVPPQKEMEEVEAVAAVVLPGVIQLVVELELPIKVMLVVV